jgi:hypothetical protein
LIATLSHVCSISDIHFAAAAIISNGSASFFGGEGVCNGEVEVMSDGGMGSSFRGSSWTSVPKQG